ncbi:YfhO family protein, partial [Streptomyces sp. URMC 123]|uniref:YfhO family protein n=1 Tax=Streptomyces sp. URMC 123 TaxID=3423403 RepID=UPI003F1AE8DA
GGHSRAVNDLGNQFVPFHAHLWDLLHGTGSGDLYFNWNSAFGVPYWAEFTSFLGNPFSLVVGLFPRDQVDLGVYVGEVLSIGLGAAMMAVWLRRFRPGPWWAAGLFGAAYGLSGWTLNDGTPDPMWLWGLTALPLMLLALLRCARHRTGKGWLWAAPMVGLAWAGNFYTAMMACIGTAVVAVVFLLALDWERGRRLVFAVRAAVVFGLGTALAAPMILPSFYASKNAQPIAPLPYHGPSLLDFLLQLLPAQRAPISIPRFFVGMLILLLVLAFPLNRAIAARTRAVWSIAVVGIALSFCWLPTVKVWHGMAQPNGSPYRAALVLTGLLATIGWLCLTHRPKPVTLLAAGGGVCALAAGTAWQGKGGVYWLTWLVVLGGGALTLALLVWLVRAGATRPGAASVRTRTGAVIAVALTAVVFAETAASAVVTDRFRDRIAFFTPHPTWGARHDALRKAVTDLDGWPRFRTDTGPTEIVNNDPQLIGGEGPSYYSSYVPQQSADVTRRLGYAWTMHGRHVIGQDNPVADAIFSVGARVRHSPDSDRVTVERYDNPPLVTVHSGNGTPAWGQRGSVFTQQEAVLGHRVYDVPAVSFAGEEPRKARHGVFLLNKRKDPYRFTAQCRPGDTAYLSATWTNGSIPGPDGKPLRIDGRYPAKAAPLIRLGTVPANGTVSVDLTAKARTELPGSPIGCLGEDRLRRAVADLKRTGATDVDASGHGLKAALPAGSRGTAVFATANVPGWQCSVDGGPQRRPISYNGLLGVRLPDSGADEVSCSFRPRGLRASVAILAGAAGALGLLAAWPALRRRLPRRGQDGRAG